VRRSPQSVLVIEAIKLIESGLSQKCDTVWVTFTSPELQQARLVQKRGMSEAVARQRISAQGSQENKIAVASVVIRNEGSFEDAWGQVVTAWNNLFPTVEVEPAAVEVGPVAGAFDVYRARPREAAEIAQLITQLSGGKRQVTREDVMAAFGEKAFLLLQGDGGLVGVIGWQVENLVARATDVVVDPKLPPQRALKVMLEDMERASGDLLAEAALVFVGSDLANLDSVWKELGYTRKAPEELTVLAWKEAALESMPKGAALFFKQLRVDRIMRPV